MMTGSAQWAESKLWKNGDVGKLNIKRDVAHEMVSYRQLAYMLCTSTPYKVITLSRTRAPNQLYK